MSLETNKNLGNSDIGLGLEEDEINLLDGLLVLVRRWKTILGVCFVTFVLACAVTLSMPNIYTATTRILPQLKESKGISSLLGGMSDLAVLSGLSDGSSSSGLYVGMLQSRTVADGVIDRLDLMRVFEWETRADAYQALKGLVEISIGKNDGFIVISTDDEDPERAAAIVNAYVEELKKLNVQINLGSAGRQRVFLEERIKKVREDLASAEEALKEFQTTNKAIWLDAQATAIIEAIARLKGELASNEVELGVLRSSQTEQNPQVKALREGISQIRDQIRRLEQSPDGRKVAEDIFIATSEVPELGMKYARLLREFKVQETLFEMLKKQHEIASFEEAKTTSSIQILDLAVPPDRKSKPRRSLIVLLVTLCSGFLAMIYIFIVEYLSRLNEDDRERWQAIRKALGFRRGQNEKAGAD
jgi:uncharacterized protein involved in exopolysaccharide biosynthesis